jgi:subtilisin family serine protease
MSRLDRLLLACALGTGAAFMAGQQAADAGEVLMDVPSYSVKAIAFPSAEKVTQLADIGQSQRVTLGQTESSGVAANLLLTRITERCGWPDPAILVWMARKVGNTQIPNGDFDNIPANVLLRLYFPSCAYLGPSQVLLKAAGSEQATLNSADSERANSLIPSDRVRAQVSNNATNISDNIRAIPVQERLGLAQARDSLVNIEPSISGKDDVSKTSNAREAINIALQFVGGTITLATFEQRRRTLFSRIVSETAKQVLEDSQKRPAISRASNQRSDQQRISFTSGMTLNDVRNELGEAFEVTDPTPAVSLEYDPNDPEAAAAAAECQEGLNEASPSEWPLPVHRLIDVLGRNHFERLKRTQPDAPDESDSGTEVRVLVADTGYPAQSLAGIRSPWNDAAADPAYYFPRKGLLRIVAQQGGQKELGVDVTAEARTYDVEPPAVSAYGAAHHGMWVASLALGGLSLGFFRADMPIPIKVHFAKLLAKKPETGEYVISREAVRRAVQYAFEKDLGIINFSISTGSQLVDLETILNAPEAKKLLFVSAAGEDADDLRSQKRWPARYGGDPAHAPDGTTFITAGAIRADGKPYTRSNRGGVQWKPGEIPWDGRDTYVDLLAPGCGLAVPEITASNGKTTMHVERRSGTSFSAPIVTFVSALLMAETLSPAQVKTRLVVTAVHRPELSSYAALGSVLDPVAALGVYHDWVKLRNGRQYFGYLENLESEIATCDHSDGGLIPGVTSLLSIDHTPAGEGAPNDEALNFYITSDIKGRVPYRVISCKGPDAAFAETVNWGIRTIDANEIIPFRLSEVERLVTRALPDPPPE